MIYHIMIDDGIVAATPVKSLAVMFGKCLTQHRIANVTVVDSTGHIIYHCD